MKPIILDCTLRDGGYYNNWDFSADLIQAYLQAMVEAKVTYVEIGLRSLINNSFKGAHAYSTESYLKSLNIPSELSVGVMVNASELINSTCLTSTLESLFPVSKNQSQVSLVRIACHAHEFQSALPASLWLKEQGYTVGFNLMQIAERSNIEIEELSKLAIDYPIDILYFADSLGSMDPQRTIEIINSIKSHWNGTLGIHTHDNMSLALQNTMIAYENGVQWLDSTVTGMGRGPGNSKTEELIIAINSLNNKSLNLVSLMRLIRKYFKPLQLLYNWGTNPYYFLSGLYRIHPTYIQEMLNDKRYSEEDIFSVIQSLKKNGAKQFNSNKLNTARNFYQGKVNGSWNPKELFKNKNVLLLGTGPGINRYKHAIEDFIQRNQPIVVALNTQTVIKESLINIRIASHPARLMADYKVHLQLPQPLITPLSILPLEIKQILSTKNIYDYGLAIKDDTFEFNSTNATLPSPLVIAYALASISAGNAKRILMAGFDGYPDGDPRNSEMNNLLKLYTSTNNAIDLLSITPTRYNLKTKSLYGACI